jgi:diguanylate cyclase (GGDEF)-like protein
MGLPQPRVQDEFPPTASLLAENERLKRELAVARARIGELEARADVDPLLDILNRRGFERELARASAHVKRYGTQAMLLFIDLDGFKAVNDRHGHGIGDALLKAVARELVAHVRASDVVGRLGGDEFGVLIWRADEEQVVAKARALEALIARIAIPHGQAQVQVGASAGTAPLLADTTPIQTIAAADRAMYARKEERRGLPPAVKWGE